MTQKTVVLIILAISILFNLFFLFKSCGEEEVAVYDPMKDPAVISRLKQDSIAQEKLKMELALLEEENERIDTQREALKVKFEQSNNNIIVRNKVKEQNIIRIKEMDELELERDINRKLIVLKDKFD